MNSLIVTGIVAGISLTNALVNVEKTLSTNVVYKYPQVQAPPWTGGGQYLLNAQNAFNTIYIAPPTIDDPNAKERWRITNVIETVTITYRNFMFTTNSVIGSSSPVREVLVSHWEDEIKGATNLSMHLDKAYVNPQYIEALQGIIITEPAEMPITGGGK